MLGSQPDQVLLTSSLLTSTWITFFCLIAPFLRSYYSYQASLIFLGIQLNLLFVTAFTEPGIIPPQKELHLLDISTKRYLQSNYTRFNYCVTCHIIKPKRTKHCKYCNNCVAIFDHHCTVSMILFIFMKFHATLLLFTQFILLQFL